MSMFLLKTEKEVADSTRVMISHHEQLLKILKNHADEIGWDVAKGSPDYKYLSFTGGLWSMFHTLLHSS